MGRPRPSRQLPGCPRTDQSPLSPTSSRPTVAYGLTGVGFAAIAGHCVAGRDFGITLHHAVGALVGGGLCSQVQPAAAVLGLSAGALIHLVH